MAQDGSLRKKHLLGRVEPASGTISETPKGILGYSYRVHQEMEKALELLQFARHTSLHYRSEGADLCA